MTVPQSYINFTPFSLAGASRSVTVVVAYLMTVTSFGWRESLLAVRSARQVANPNFGFQRQLQDFDQSGGLKRVSFITRNIHGSIFWCPRVSVRGCVRRSVGQKQFLCKTEFTIPSRV